MSDQAQLPIEAMLSVVSKNHFNLIYTTYSIQLPQTTLVELDVLALQEEANTCSALMFEVKNRNEKHRPTK